jgi:hypothetical protein
MNFFPRFEYKVGFFWIYLDLFIDVSKDLSFKLTILIKQIKKYIWFG